MTSRVINDPSALGWEYDPDTGRWVWGGPGSGSGGDGGGDIEPGNSDGEILTWSTADAEWMPSDDMIVKGGNVGIGTDAPLSLGSKYKSLDIRGVNGGGIVLGDLGAQSGYVYSGASSMTFEALGTNEIKLRGDGKNRLTIDSTGNVGIGMTPLRSTAKEQLAEWKASFDARLKEEPKADKKAITLEITDDAFEVLPTEEIVAEWMETRAAGDKLQVKGHAHVDGVFRVSNANSINVIQAIGSTQTTNIKPNGNLYREGSFGISLSTTGIRPVDGTGSTTGADVDGLFDIGTSGHRFKDAHFSGTVNATEGSFSGAVRTGSTSTATTGAVVGDAVYSRNAVADNTASNEVWRGYGAGEITSRIKSNGNAVFSGTVTATTINGKVTDVADHIKAITPTQIANWDAGTGGGGGGATTDGRISDTQIIHWDRAYGWGDHAAAGYQPAGNYLTPGSLNGYATESWVNSQGFAKGSFVPTSGNTTISGTLTATDFVATSDERLKQNATTAPVGIVEQLRGVEFEWKEDGRQDAGVIAQEVEKVLPHLVHDTGEHKAVNYNGLVAYLIEEVKALRAEVEALK